MITEKLGKEPSSFQSSDFDSENVDPASLFPKGQAGSFDTKLKGPHFSLNTAQHNVPSDQLRNTSRKRKADDTEPLPTQGSSLKRKLDFESTPIVPLGRSPPRKHAGLLSRRRAGGTYKRIDPPGSSSSIPFSLGAALAGTVPRTSKKVTKKRWEFQIYEDSPQEEMANLMEHSTCTLDISDDENRISHKSDKDNKENVPPTNYQTRTAAHQSQDIMTEKIRSPLGDLEVKEFYAEGCDAASAFIIPADDEAGAKMMPQIEEEESPVSPCPAPESLDCSKSIDVKAIAASGEEEERQSKLDSAHLSGDQDGDSVGPNFEIWESGSAKADNDTDGIGSESTGVVCT